MDALLVEPLKATLFGVVEVFQAWRWFRHAAQAYLRFVGDRQIIDYFTPDIW
jgi:hypothetical protein